MTKRITTVLFALLLVLGTPAMAFAVAPVVDPTTETTATVEPTVEPAAEPTAEPIVEPTAEPVTEPVAEPTAEPTTEPVVEPTAEPVAEPVAEKTTEPTSTETEPSFDSVTQSTAAFVEAPVANRDDVFTYTRGVLSVNALENDTWDSTLNAEILSAEIAFTYDERDNSEPAVALTFDPATGYVEVDFGEYVGEDTGLSRQAAVLYVLSDSSGQTSNGEISFVEAGADPNIGPVPPELPETFDDTVISTERGILQAAPLANDFWASNLNVELANVTLISTYDERDNSSPTVTLTYDLDAWLVTVDFGEYIGEDTGQIREAYVSYELRDELGQSDIGTIHFIEDSDSDPSPAPEPEPSTDVLFGDPVNHTISGNVMLNNTWSTALSPTVVEATIVEATINTETGLENIVIPASWSVAIDPEGTISVSFGQELPDFNVPIAKVRYTLENSEGDWTQRYAYFNYGVTSILSGCTATAETSWGALLEQVDPGNATSWNDFFTVGDVVTSGPLTDELLKNGSLQTIYVYEDTHRNDCANIIAAYLGTNFFSDLIARTPPADPTPPVVDEPAPPVVEEPPVVNDPTPPKTDDPTPPKTDDPTPPKTDTPTFPKIPNAGASADTSSSASLAILAIILLASGGLVMAAPGKEK